MSVAVGLATFFLMPASITETHKILHGKASWLHGKSGWFTEREEKILGNRILRDDPSKGDMNNRQHVDLKGIWSALKDINLWPLYIVSPFNLQSHLQRSDRPSLEFLHTSHFSLQQTTYLLPLQLSGTASFRPICSQFQAIFSSLLM